MSLPPATTTDMAPGTNKYQKPSELQLDLMMHPGRNKQPASTINQQALQLTNIRAPYNQITTPQNAANDQNN